MQHESAKHERHHRIFRKAEGQKRNEASRRRRIRRRLGRGNAAHSAITESLRRMSPALRRCVCKIRRNCRAAAWKKADEEANKRSLRHWFGGIFPVLTGRKNLAQAFGRLEGSVGDKLLFEHREYFRYAEQAHDHRNQIDARLQGSMIPNVKRALLRTGSSPTVPRRSPKTVTASALVMELVAR